MNKLDVTRVKDMHLGDLKFFVGRIVLAQEPIISPISNTPCVFYEVFVERRVARGKRRVWEPYFSEERCADFILSDPEGGSAFVSGTSNPVKFYTKIDVNGGGGGAFRSPVATDNNPLLKDLLQRRGVRTEGFFGSTIGSDQIRYREGSFHVNEMVAILGVATASIVNGVSMKTIKPCTTKSLDETYMKAHNWSNLDKMCWADLTKNNSIIGTDDPKYMKGVGVPSLSECFTPVAFATPVDLGTGNMVPSPLYHSNNNAVSPPYLQTQDHAIYAPTAPAMEYQPPHPPPPPNGPSITGAAALYSQQYDHSMKPEEEAEETDSLIPPPAYE